VTGGAGFIGHHFIDYILQNSDWKIVSLDRLDPAADLNRFTAMPSYNKNKHRLAICHHDLKAEISDEVAKLIITGNRSFDNEPFDYVVHFAAASHVTRSVTNPLSFVMDNVVGTCNLLDLFRKHRKYLSSDGKILVFGTDEITGPAFERPFKEWDIMNPGNPYAASKMGAEALTTAYANTYGLPIIATHTTNIFGERQHSEKFIPLAINQIYNGETVKIHTNDSGNKICTRFYTYVENVSSAVKFILENCLCMNGEPYFGKYNIVGEREVSNLEIVEKIAKILKKPFKYELISFDPTRPKPDLRYDLDGSLLESLGWRRVVLFDEGLEKTVKYTMGNL
jgi:dTDP-glucose 4,6-dehydratase